VATEHRKLSSTSILTNLGFGVLCGLLMAVLFSLFVGVLALLRGSDWNTTYQVSTIAVIRGYFLAGVLGGALFGLLRPLARNRLGAATVGTLVGPIVYGAVMTVAEGQPQWTSGPTIVAGLLVGGAVGWIVGKPDALR
jgi:predicted RND superfamily exporter protein